MTSDDLGLPQSPAQAAEGDVRKVVPYQHPEHEMRKEANRLVREAFREHSLHTHERGGKPTTEFKAAARAVRRAIRVRTPHHSWAKRVCHAEQLDTWADDFVTALAAGGVLRDGMTYDDGLDVRAAIKREIRSVVEAAFLHPAIKETSNVS